MRLVVSTRKIRAFAFALLGSIVAQNAAADEQLAARFVSLWGQENAAISSISKDDAARLTRLPGMTGPEFLTTRPAGDYSGAFLSQMPKASGGAQWQCLAEALYFEARGESVRGIFAVGEVILNRVDSRRYPDTVCDVINQGTGRKWACQFTYTCDGLAENIHEPLAYIKVGKIARLLLDGLPRDLTKGATHYHTKAVNPSWARVYPRVAEIGFHYFYRQPVRRASN